MAKIREEMLIVKVSSLIKDGSAVIAPTFDDDVCSELEDTISELIGKGYVVEIIKE